MRPVLLQIRAALAVEEAAGPRALLTRRTRPDRRRQLSAQRLLELGTLHGAEPRTDEVRNMRDVRTRGRLPPVEILLSFLDQRPLETSDADAPLELHEHRRHAVGAGGLIDLRMGLSSTAACLRDRVRPPFSIEEPCCPCELVPIHARLKTTSEVLLSVPRTSHVRATRAAISCDEGQSSMSFLPAKPDSRSCQ